MSETKIKILNAVKQHNAMVNTFEKMLDILPNDKIFDSMIETGKFLTCLMHEQGMNFRMNDKTGYIVLFNV